MINNISKKNLILFFIFIIGGILRLYNINYDDLWTDEMISYWLSDPSRNFYDTIILVFESNLMVTYELGLKYFHYIFGYNFEISRYFSVIIGILSIILFSFLLNSNSNSKSVIFGTFLLAINIYHIKYSLELRSYILTFLLGIILLQLIFSNSSEREKITFIRGFFIFLISLLMLFSHSFSIIILFSLNLYFLIKFIFFKKISKNQISIIFLTTLACGLFLFFYLQNITHTPYWVENVKLSFYTNFYFSKFFGSRIIGLIYLISLIYLIIKQKNIFKKLDINFYFLILIFFSYFLPLLYSYIFNPVLVDRYIFFVLIPVIFLISKFVFLVESKLIRNLIIIIITFVTLANHLLKENTFRQFYTDIHPTKPDIGAVFAKINETKIMQYTFLMNNKNDLSNELYKNHNEIYKNYLIQYSRKSNLENKFIDYKTQTYDKLPERFWIIYLKDITNKNFVIPEKLTNYNILNKYFYNRVELYLLEKKLIN